MLQQNQFNLYRASAYHGSHALVLVCLHAGWLHSDKHVHDSLCQLLYGRVCHG
jgi:hypothetical protein